VKKAQIFYALNEWTNSEQYLKKNGLKPYKIHTWKPSGSQPITIVDQYIRDGHIYDVLESDQCYSGFMVTIARLPLPEYEELLNLALCSPHEEERGGALGIILKNHPKEFLRYLATANQEDILLESSQKEIGRIAAFVFDCIKPYTSASTMDEIYDLCGKLKHKYYRPTVWERIIDRIVGASE
jgi:hypothetical protein